MTALLYSALLFLIKINQIQKYPYHYVTLNDNSLLYFKDWAHRIQLNFDRSYYIPIYSELDFNYTLNLNLVRRRGIYKDTFNSHNLQNDYMFRPNVAIAIAVAP